MKGLKTTLVAVCLGAATPGCIEHDNFPENRLEEQRTVALPAHQFGHQKPPTMPAWEGEPPVGEHVPVVQTSGELAIQDAVMLGNYGSIGLIEPIEAVAKGWSEPDYTTISLEATAPNGRVAMLMLELQVGLDELVPRTVFTDEDHSLAVTVIGCAGSASGSWDIDDAATSVRVTVSSMDPESPYAIVHVQASFGVPGKWDTTVLSGALELGGFIPE